MDSSNAEKAWEEFVDSLELDFAVGWDKRRMHLYVGFKAGYASRESEVEVLREQLAAAEAVIERVRALATQFSENESYGDYTEGKEAAGDEVLDILTLTRGVVLAEIIREAKAEAWDSGHNSATMRTAQELLALLPQRKTAANPYRTGDTNA